MNAHLSKLISLGGRSRTGAHKMECLFQFGIACTHRFHPSTPTVAWGGNICVVCHGERKTRAPHAKSLAAFLNCWRGWGCWGCWGGMGGGAQPGSFHHTDACTRAKKSGMIMNVPMTILATLSRRRGGPPACRACQVMIFGGRCGLCSQAAARLGSLVGKGAGFCCVTSFQE